MWAAPFAKPTTTHGASRPFPSRCKEARGERNGRKAGREMHMSMKQIDALRHRGEGEETEVYVSGNGHAGLVPKSFLIEWLAKRGRLVLV